MASCELPGETGKDCRELRKNNQNYCWLKFHVLGSANAAERLADKDDALQLNRQHFSEVSKSNGCPNKNNLRVTLIYERDRIERRPR